jgi:hypothetical protein
MYRKTALAAALLVLAAPAFAQTTQGVAGKTPGQQMQSATKSTAPGASEYAPGHKTKKHAMKHTKKSTAKSTVPGASEPGQTTGMGTKRY